MPRIAYVNGQYVPHNQAGVSVEDRGYQFADGVYEVVAVVSGCIADWAPHMGRLKNSLASLGIKMPLRETAMHVVMRQMIRRNRLDHGILYLQVTRGVAPRDHAYPAGLQPSLVMTCRSVPLSKSLRLAGEGVSVKTFSEERWARPDIKTVSLLPNVLAKQSAREAGDHEAWFVDSEGYITEGASTNAWIVAQDGALVTRPLSRAILPGVVRAIVLRVAKDLGLQVRQEPFTLADVADARGAFITSTGGVFPVVAVDGQAIANGVPGETTQKLVGAYRQHLADQTPDPAGTLRLMMGTS